MSPHLGGLNCVQEPRIWTLLGAATQEGLARPKCKLLYRGLRGERGVASWRLPPGYRTTSRSRYVNPGIRGSARVMSPFRRTHGTNMDLEKYKNDYEGILHGMDILCSERQVENGIKQTGLRADHISATRGWKDLRQYSRASRRRYKKQLQREDKERNRKASTYRTDRNAEISKAGKNDETKNIKCPKPDLSTPSKKRNIDQRTYAQAKSGLVTVATLLLTSPNRKLDNSEVAWIRL